MGSVLTIGLGSESESDNDTAEVDTFSKTSSGIQYCKSGIEVRQRE